MEDREFVLQVLGDFGQEVAKTTTAVVWGHIGEDTYVSESSNQLRRYIDVLLEWKNGCRDNSTKA